MGKYIIPKNSYLEFTNEKELSNFKKTRLFKCKNPNVKYIEEKVTLTPLTFKENIKNICKYIPKYDIPKHRDIIYKYLSKQIPPNFTKINTERIELIYKTIDDYYFGGEITKYIKNSGSKIAFKIGSGTATAATCSNKDKHCTYTITVASAVFLNAFNHGQKQLMASGVLCRSRLECLLITIEHEMVHLLNYVFCPEKKAHGTLFKYISKNLFGHTNIYHDLNDLKTVEKIFTKNDFKIGMKVAFEYKGVTYKGTIHKINIKTVGVNNLDPPHPSKAFRIPFSQVVIKK